MPGEVKVFRVKGVMRLREGELRPFKIEVTALSPEHAVEKIYSELGSRHKVSRKHIRIEKVEEIKLEEVESEHIKALLSIDKIVTV